MVVNSVPADQIVACEINVIAQDNLVDVMSPCDSEVTVTSSISGPIGTLGCSGTRYLVTYTATDDCGRSITHVQTYTLANEGPEFICPPDICMIECPADNDMIQTQFDDYAGLASVITSCEESTVSIDNNFSPNAFIPQNCMNPFVAVPGATAYQIVRFTATDACGRNNTCTALVVLIDNDGPEVNGSVSVGLADCNDALSLIHI